MKNKGKLIKASTLDKHSQSLLHAAVHMDIVELFTNLLGAAPGLIQKLCGRPWLNLHDRYPVNSPFQLERSCTFGGREFQRLCNGVMGQLSP